MGAERHPEGNCRQAQCRGGRRHERSGGAQEVRGPWIADAAQGQAVAGGARRLAEGGNRQMVADDQGRQRQGRLSGAALVSCERTGWSVFDATAAPAPKRARYTARFSSTRWT